ncbi:MFS transporter [Bradyrhizobium sp. 179]|uniref:MFS transporter n=1 Tax=Bradyrhizobium sp. 179 TaxID=2782648 RepID=UPI001FFB8FFF|nr:MFS transporter [Bradyrhizobium sp. 179]MCK1545693.1 MFS transporter [Bradyrhizobium sp. 179]
MPIRFAGWSVVWVAFTVAAFAWGIGFYGPGVFLQTLHASKGWPIATISAAITTHFLVGAAIVVYLPEAHRAIGIARATMIGAVLTAAGIVAWSMTLSPWQLFAAAFISGGGWALTSGAAINAMIAPWFDRDRPMAISHAFNGASIGGVVFTPLLVSMIDGIGFPATALVVGLAMVIVVAPLAHRYLRQGSEDLGLAPDGQPLDRARPRPESEARLPRAALMRTRAFVTVSTAFALALFAQVGLLSHLLSRLSPVLGTTAAAAAMSLTTISAVAGRLLLGWLIGDHDRRYAACANFLVQSIGVVLLCVTNSPLLLLVGCVLFGLGVGNVAAIPALIAQTEFRAVDLGTVVALVIATNQAVFALAPAALGAIRDASTNYTLSFAIAAVIEVAAAITVLAGRQRRR